MKMKKLAIILTIISLVLLISCGSDPKGVPIPTPPDLTESSETVENEQTGEKTSNVVEANQAKGVNKDEEVKENKPDSNNEGNSGADSLAGTNTDTNNNGNSGNDDTNQSVTVPDNNTNTDDNSGGGDSGQSTSKDENISEPAKRSKPKVTTSNPVRFVRADFYVNHTPEGNPSLETQEQNDSVVVTTYVYDVNIKNAGKKIKQMRFIPKGLHQYFDEKIFDTTTLEGLKWQTIRRSLLSVEVEPYKEVNTTTGNIVMRYNTQRKPSKYGSADDYTDIKVLGKKIEGIDYVDRSSPFAKNEKLFPNPIYKDLDIYKKVKQASKSIKNLKKVIFDVEIIYEDGTTETVQSELNFERTGIVRECIDVYDVSVENGNNKYGEFKGNYLIFGKDSLDNIPPGSITLGNGA